jgi:hypothetical protein
MYVMFWCCQLMQYQIYCAVYLYQLLVLAPSKFCAFTISSSIAVAFSLVHSVQTVSGAHPASYPMDSGDSFPGGKAAGR